MKRNYTIKHTELVSVIIPVYNVEKYIKRCLDSVIVQTYTNLEIILVDDGSTDQSGEICDYYANIDSRVRAIHQNNKGASAARNTGLRKAKGSFVTFVDADDTAYPMMIEALYKDLMVHNGDVAVCGITTIFEYETNLDKYSNDLQGSVKKLKSFDALVDMLYERDVTNSPCAKLYKKAVLEGILFPENVTIAEDLFFNYQVFLRSVGVIVNKANLYEYFQREGSAMNAVFSSSRMHGLQITKKVMEDSRRRSKKLYRAAKYRFFIEAIYTITTIANDAKSDSHKQYFDECKDAIRMVRLGIIGDKNVKLKVRLYAIICLISPSLLINILSFKKRLARN